MNANKVLDVKGMACPMPLVKTKKALNDLASGEVLEVITTDKGAKTDLTAWTKTVGHELLDSKEDQDVFTFYIKKG
ncbi:MULTISPECIES: sulfurtransferase TusA family protein [Bacillus]|uniref:sulfurtransferase TusA family protein n=1 Tax=Bacillus TaxID=1386 RepID=UPI000BB6AC0A|nr:MULTISPECIES: sulfurtransferase TusA family protein [Bacillus]